MIRHILLTAPVETRVKFKMAMVGGGIAGAVRPVTGKYNTVVSCNHAGTGKVARTVYDAETRQSLPGKVVREEGSKDGKDSVVNNAYNFSGLTHKFFNDLFSRDSIDNDGMHLHSTIRFGHRYPNAFWNGKQMVYGSGDGEIFNDFCVLDVVAHELTHGVTEHTAGLVYRAQPGALNEHFSDVFGSLVKQRSRNQKASDADWIIGEGLFTDKINGVGIRLMSNPGHAYDDPKIGRDRQTSHMNEYNHSPEDNYCVHINSGIPNKAFYEFAKNIGGYSWELAGKVWYEVLSTKLNENSTFQNMVDATQEVVIQNYGTGIEYKALKEAWKIVGLAPKHYIFNQMSTV